ncbi:DUF2515 domain-containing protein [Neobacillus niacini]|uniref:DUF2515 domain-containing protein n=1 Tax=Neobacillus niacini TaxID=86668 RepID=UPI003983AEE4
MIIFFISSRDKTPIKIIKDELKGKMKKDQGILDSKNLPKEEQDLLERIEKKTRERNVNNVTRTNAYFEIYQKYPEIHWAFLGHMVSRNGGWNMTDLKGDFLTRLLTKKERNDFFAFIERGNWLIFQDAYPQLLLYSESIKKKKSLFYLLPYMNISTFMESIWNYFWRKSDSYVLTIALVINEQNYLEKRVIQNPIYQKGVLNTIEFKLQDVLSFNHILFPYRKNSLAGQTVHQFQSLHERILLGKRLYAVLFQSKELLNHFVQWANEHRHTGSRKDYWPHIFNNVNEGIPGIPYQLRLNACKLRWGARKIYSPDLSSAWKNVQHQEAEKGDWFSDWKIADYLSEQNETQIIGEIEDEYCKTLERLELTALAKKVITIFN